MPNHIILLPEVIQQTGYSRTSIYRLISQGEFPPQRRLGPNKVGWWQTEISKWVQNRIAQFSGQKVELEDLLG